MQQPYRTPLSSDRDEATGLPFWPAVVLCHDAPERAVITLQFEKMAGNLGRTLPRILVLEPVPPGSAQVYRLITDIPANVLQLLPELWRARAA